MKAVVLDITGKEATVMTNKGDIIGIRNKGYDIGQEIDTPVSGSRSTANVYRFVSTLSAVAAAAVLLFGGFRAYYSPYGTVSLDVNPSIEYTINRFDRVIEVAGVNEDGSVILSQINTDSLINKDIEDAVEATIDQIEADGYMTDEDGNFVVVSANTRKEDHTDKLLERLDDKVKGHGNIKPLSFKVSDDELSKAHDEGLSAGKKKMVDRLEEASGEEIDRSKWSNRSIRDIEEEYDRINDGRGVDAKKESESPESGTLTSPDSEPENRPESRPENKTENKIENKTENKPENNLESRPENKPENKPDTEEVKSIPEGTKPDDNSTEGMIGPDPEQSAPANMDPSPMQNDGGPMGEPGNMPPEGGVGPKDPI